MKTLASAILAAVMLIAVAGTVERAWAGSPGPHHVNVRSWGRPGPGWGRPGWGPGPRVWWGGGWGWGPRVWWGPGWWGYPTFPYAYAPPAPAVVVQPAPQTFIQQIPRPATALQQAPPPAGQAEAPGTYWYYCAESRGYYPHVGECPGGWLTVVPPGSSSQ